MKYTLQMQCVIDLSQDPSIELAGTISAVLQQYPQPQQKRQILKDLELLIAASLSTLDEQDQVASSLEGGDAGEQRAGEHQEEPKAVG